MKTILLLMLCMLAINLNAQMVDFQTGDVILYADTEHDRLQQYIVDRENDMEGLNDIVKHLTRFGKPYCPLAVDLRKNNIYELWGRPMTLAIREDHVAFRLPIMKDLEEIEVKTKSRVFVFICIDPFKRQT